MLKFRILFLYATTAIFAILAVEKDQKAEENKNINLYLVPLPGLKPFPPENKEIVQEESDDNKIALKVLQELQKDQNAFVVHPNYNSDNVGYSQSPNKLEFVTPESTNVKYALEPEGPNETKVTVKVIKEHKKTFAVDPSYIESKSDVPEYNNPEIRYEKIEPKYPNIELNYKKSDPSYVKYEIKAEEPKEKNVFVKVLEEKSNDDNTYYKPNYRQIETVYKNSDPEYKVPGLVYNYKIKDQEPRKENVFVKVVKEVEPKYTKLITEYKNLESEYKNPEQEYVKYKVNTEDPEVFVKLLKEDRTTFDSRYKNDNSQLYEKSITEYRKPESDFRQSKIEYKKYDDNEEENKEKRIFVKVKDDKKRFTLERRYQNDNLYLEPVYEKSVIKYRKSEPEYRRTETEYKQYDDSKEENGEENVFVKVDKEDRLVTADSKYQNDNLYLEPVYKKSVTEYKKSEPDYRQIKSTYSSYEDNEKENKDRIVFVEDRKSTEYEKSEPEYRISKSEYDKYEVNEKKSKIKEVQARVLKKDKNTFVDDSKYNNDNKYFEKQDSEAIADYESEKPEPEYKTSKFDYKTLDVKEKEPKEQEVHVRVVKEDRREEDSKVKNDNTYLEQNYRKTFKKYEKSEPSYKESESDYDKYEDKKENSKEIIFAADSRYEKDNTQFESKYREPSPDYKESESESGYNQQEDNYGKYYDNEKENKAKNIVIKVFKEDKETSEEESKYKNDNSYYESDNKKYESEAESNSENDSKYEEPKHDLLVKIWTKKTR